MKTKRQFLHNKQKGKSTRYMAISIVSLSDHYCAPACTMDTVGREFGRILIMSVLFCEINVVS